MNSTSTAKFSPGRIVLAPAALRLLSAEDIRKALEAHVSGNWGDLCQEDCEENNQGLTVGRRLLSVYHTDAGNRFWLITEADRSVTNIYMREPHHDRDMGSLLKVRARNLVRRLNKITYKPTVGTEGIKLRFCIR